MLGLPTSDSDGVQRKKALDERVRLAAQLVAEKAIILALIMDGHHRSEMEFTRAAGLAKESCKISQ